MSKIITIIFKILNTIIGILMKFQRFLMPYIKLEDLNKVNSKPKDIRYQQFGIDIPPIIEPFKPLEKLDYKQLLKENNKLKPVKRRNGKTIDSNIICKRCNAPSDYLYDNSKGKQFGCKVCNHLFSPDCKESFKDMIIKCPHCFYQLSLHHERGQFNVYRCPNNKCSFYINNLKAMGKEDKQLYKKEPSKLKLRYYYRAFDIDLPTLNQDFRDFVRTPVDLSKIYKSFHILGIILTYHVNYRLSTRMTAAVMWDIHNVKVSHTTVANYAEAVASVVHPVLEHYPYELSDSIAGDETYAKVKGKWWYCFFMFDSVNKIITSYRIFEKRDAVSAIKAFGYTLAKYSKLPDVINFFTDGNPIYNLALQFWISQGYNIDLKQIIGLKNRDETSKTYRSKKQVIERLNRTFNFHYEDTNGFGNGDKANTFMILFSTCFNFLRPHASLKYRVPQHDDKIQSMPNMPAKWLALIEMGYDYLKEYN